MEKIFKAYEIINDQYDHIMNTEVTRNEITIKLQEILPDVNIICNDENNTSLVIEFCCLVADLYWFSDNTEQHTQLIFGNVEQVERLQRIIE